MNTQYPISDIQFVASREDPFQKYEGSFFINAPCILSRKKLVYVEDLYDLLDFLDNGKLETRKVKFFFAYLNGHYCTLVLLEVETGELLKRSYRLYSDILPCHWLLIEYRYVNPKFEPETPFMP